MLEDPTFAPVVSWGPLGDCFVVKDMNEFTKTILPRMFKHSNFASFVRQLNKYDFHKVRLSDRGAGERGIGWVGAKERERNDGLEWCGGGSQSWRAMEGKARRWDIWTWDGGRTG